MRREWRRSARSRPRPERRELTMNRLNLLAATALVGSLTLGLAACDDLLTETPKNFLTTDSYYQTPEQMEVAVLSAYQPITRGDVWEWNLIIVTELASDHVRIH